MGNCGGADLNGDRKVDNLDITLVNNCYGLWKPECQKYDLNNDDKIDILDIAVVTDRFGETGCGCDMAQSDLSKGMCVSINDKGCVFAIPDYAKPSCWPSGMAQSYNNGIFHYKEGEIMGTNTLYFNPYEMRWTNYSANWYSCVCENNVWEEAGDSSKERCESGIGVAKTLTFLNPVPQNVWMNTSCCGDDCFEFYVAGSDGTSACCNSSDKIVIGGVCHNSDYIPPPIIFCGDAICSSEETCSSCAIDCGVCPISGGSSSGGGGSGGGIHVLITQTITSQQISEGYTKELTKNERIVFKTENNEEHSVSLNYISEDKVTITVKSEPVILTLGIGESKKLNLSSQDYYNLYVKLESIANGKAKIKIQSIHEEIIPTPATEKTGEELMSKIIGFVKTEKGIGLILIFVVLIIVFSVYSKKKRSRKLKVEKKNH